MNRVWLPLVLLLAFLFRFISLTSFPVGFNADEASFGYDAYSILKTGRDQWGTYMPLVFKSFGDYKSPVYGYLAVPFIAVFGLNQFAVRLPNVIIGTLAVYVLYLLVFEIRSKLKIKLKIELLAGFLLAISPWSVMLSRGAFEANLITLFLPLGIYLFVKDKLNWSAIVFGLSLFTYHSAKILSPILFFTPLIVFKKKPFSSFILYGLFFTVMLFTLINGAGARISERSITSGALEEGAKRKIELISSGKNPTLSKLMHNKYQVTVTRFVNNYLQYVSPRFLLSQGAGEYYYGMIHGVGVIYLFEVILFLGILKLFFDNKYRKIILLLLLWLLVSPIPAALSTGVGYSGHRAIGMIPVIQILVSFGVFGWYLALKRANLTKRIILLATVVLLLILNVHKFANVYFRNIPPQAYQQMLSGNLEIARWLLDNGRDKNIFISRSLSEPQIFIAFEDKLNPLTYQNETKNWRVETWVDQIPQYSLKNYTIKSIDWENDINIKNTILVAKSGEFPKSIIPDFSFSYPEGTPNIYVKFNQ